ncbi:hypothetical protein ACU686_30720 [Yinghuangia aomiensis]
MLGESRSKLSASNSFQTTMTTKIDGQAMMTVTSQMQYKPELAIRMSMKFEPSFIEQSGGDPSDIDDHAYLMTPDVMYMNMGPKMAAENGGKPWAKIDIAALAKADKSGQGAKLQKMFDQAQDNRVRPGVAARPAPAVRRHPRGRQGDRRRCADDALQRHGEPGHAAEELGGQHGPFAEGVRQAGQAVRQARHGRHEHGHVDRRRQPAGQADDRHAPGGRRREGRHGDDVDLLEVGDEGGHHPAAGLADA